MANVERYAVVDASNVVINLIEYDGESPYNPGEGLRLILTARDDQVDIGWLYENGVFSAP